MNLLEAAKKTRPAAPPLPPGWIKPDPNKPAIPPGAKVPVATTPSPKAPSAGYDPMSSKYAGGAADRRAAKKKSSMRLKISNPALLKHQILAIRRSEPSRRSNSNSSGCSSRRNSDYPISISRLPWYGTVPPKVSRQEPTCKDRNLFCFFDFSGYYKYPGELNQYKWKRLEYDDMDTDPIIGSVYKASWQDCVTISICHEFSHAIQSCKDIDVLQKVVVALPKYKGNCDDGLHGEFFKAIYRCIRGNIMGTKKEDRYLSFGQFMDEVKKPEEKKREIRIPKLPPKITEPELVSLDTNK